MLSMPPRFSRLVMSLAAGPKLKPLGSIEVSNDDGVECISDREVLDDDGIEHGHRGREQHNRNGRLLPRRSDQDNQERYE